MNKAENQVMYLCEGPRALLRSTQLELGTQFTLSLAIMSSSSSYNRLISINDVILYSWHVEKVIEEMRCRLCSCVGFLHFIFLLEKNGNLVIFNNSTLDIEYDAAEDSRFLISYINLVAIYSIRV